MMKKNIFTTLVKGLALSLCIVAALYFIDSCSQPKSSGGDSAPAATDTPTSDPGSSSQNCGTNQTIDDGSGVSPTPSPTATSSPASASSSGCAASLPSPTSLPSSTSSVVSTSPIPATSSSVIASTPSQTLINQVINTPQKQSCDAQHLMYKLQTQTCISGVTIATDIGSDFNSVKQAFSSAGVSDTSMIDQLQQQGYQVYEVGRLNSNTSQPCVSFIIQDPGATAQQVSYHQTCVSTNAGSSVCVCNN